MDLREAVRIFFAAAWPFDVAYELRGVRCRECDRLGTAQHRKEGHHALCDEHKLWGEGAGDVAGTLYEDAVEYPPEVAEAMRTIEAALR